MARLVLAAFVHEAPLLCSDNKFSSRIVALLPQEVANGVLVVQVRLELIHGLRAVWLAVLLLLLLLLCGNRAETVSTAA